MKLSVVSKFLITFVIVTFLNLVFKAILHNIEPGIESGVFNPITLVFNWIVIAILWGKTPLNPFKS